ncbi:glycosyltransferase family 2 protein [Geobacillus stearothermophilus]|nr:glycosyltransferase family 2 protein [Geobacillus stearothermophilus]
MDDLVSIVTPVYNAEKYLKYTIESVINQDYDNWELIIIDDCSKDNSRLIAERYMKKDKRIKLISLEKNRGVAYARNIGIKAAKGRYIAFLDSDDLWYPNKLSKQLDFMKKNDYYFTFSSYELINDEGIRLNKVIKAPNIVDYKRLLKGNPIGCLTVMIDKKRIEDIEMPEIRHEDYATWLNITKNGNIAYGLNEILALYRKSRNSLSSNKIKAIIWTWNIYRKNQKLGLLRSTKCWGMYVFNTLLKYIGK